MLILLVFKIQKNQNLYKKKTINPKKLRTNVFEDKVTLSINRCLQHIPIQKHIPIQNEGRFLERIKGEQYGK
jgi:hypothetical protein